MSAGTGEGFCAELELGLRLQHREEEGHVQMLAHGESVDLRGGCELG